MNTAKYEATGRYYRTFVDGWAIVVDPEGGEASRLATPTVASRIVREKNAELDTLASIGLWGDDPELRAFRAGQV